MENPLTMRKLKIPFHKGHSLMEVCRTNIRRQLRTTISNYRKINIRSKIVKKSINCNLKRRHSFKSHFQARQRRLPRQISPGNNLYYKEKTF